MGSSSGRSRDMDKIRTKALRRQIKKKWEAISTYRRAPDVGKTVLVYDSMNPGPKITVKVIKTQMHNGALEIVNIECPHCKTPIGWHEKWKGFICMKATHPKRKGIYEMVNPEKRMSRKV